MKDGGSIESHLKHMKGIINKFSAIKVDISG